MGEIICSYKYFVLTYKTSAHNKRYQSVLTICHAGIEAVSWQLLFLKCFTIAVFD